MARVACPTVRPRSWRAAAGRWRYHSGVDGGIDRTGSLQGRKTIQKLARGFDVDVRDVSKVARRVFGLPASRAADRQFLLSSRQCRQVADALGTSPQPSLLGLSGT